MNGYANVLYNYSVEVVSNNDYDKIRSLVYNKGKIINYIIRKNFNNEIALTYLAAVNLNLKQFQTCLRNFGTEQFRVFAEYFFNG